MAWEWHKPEEFLQAAWGIARKQGIPEERLSDEKLLGCVEKAVETNQMKFAEPYKPMGDPDITWPDQDALAQNIAQLVPQS